MSGSRCSIFRSSRSIRRPMPSSLASWRWTGGTRSDLAAAPCGYQGVRSDVSRHRVSGRGLGRGSDRCLLRAASSWTDSGRLGRLRLPPGMDRVPPVVGVLANLALKAFHGCIYQTRRHNMPAVELAIVNIVSGSGQFPRRATPAGFNRKCRVLCAVADEDPWLPDRSSGR